MSTSSARRLPLHWQILIGMVAGALIGLGLNYWGSTRVSTTSVEIDGRPVSITVQRDGSVSDVRWTSPIGKDQFVRVVADANGLPAEGTGTMTMDDFARDHPQLATALETTPMPVSQAWGGWFSQLGGLFLRMLKMVAVPLIVVSLLSGVMNLGSGRGVGRMFRFTLLYYLATSMLAIVTGLVIVNLIRPGLGRGGAAAGAEVESAKPLGEVLFAQIEAMIPANPIAAFAEPNFLSIITFTLAIALFALRCSESTRRTIGKASEAGLEVMMALTTAIIALAPIGVFFLIAAVTATQGPEVFISLGWYVIAVAIALAIHACITLPIILRLFARRRPMVYAKAMSPALLTAFSSASSNGTLPLTMDNVSERAGVQRKTGSFVLPLGATINMDGTALYEVVAVMFIAQMHFGELLPLTTQIVVAMTALLASVGAAGIPHAGLVMMAIILQAVGLPAEMQGVILAVDRVLDMARTAVNVWSDSCGCAVVDRLASADQPEVAAVAAA